MKAMHIDFAPASIARTIARTGALTWSIGVLALLALLVAGMNYQTLGRQHAARASMMQTLAHDRQTRQKVLAPGKKPVRPALQVAAINRTIAMLNLPWHELLDAIERATPAEIALLSLEPLARGHLVKGVAESRDGAAMIGYIASLQEQRIFVSASLTHHEINEQDVSRPHRFQFEAQWQQRLPESVP